MEEKKCNQQFKVKGNELLGKIKEIIHAGNVRRIIIKDTKGKKYLELPVTVGVFGVLLAPSWAAIAALVAVASSFSIEVVNIEPKEEKEEKEIVAEEEE